MSPGQEVSSKKCQVPSHKFGEGRENSVRTWYLVLPTCYLSLSALPELTHR